jgi:tRNA(Ile)-lysidine synthase
MGSDTQRRVEPEAAQAESFLAALAAGLPARGFWSSPLLVGVSGGADSVGLLCGLRGLACPDAVGRMTVVHVEHDLREDAAADREFVAGLAARLGLPFVWRRCAVRSEVDERGEGVESLARRLRYAFFEEVAREVGARHVLVAHTADDQAETILHRILRGTGLAGLAGMPAARELCDGVSLLRPLLSVSRASVREFLAARAESWREDASNSDVRYARNFLRHEVIGRCEDGPYPAATAALVRLGGQAGKLGAALRAAAEQLLDVHASRAVRGAVVLRTAGLVALDRHLLAEMFAILWDREGWPRRDMTARHYEQLAALAAAGGESVVCATDFPGGVRASQQRAGLLELRPLN